MSELETLVLKVENESSPELLSLRKTPPNWLHSPLVMVGAALAIRMATMLFTYKLQLDPWLDHWAFGWETGRVARSIVTGHGFSSPYSAPTGPTALIPPVYVYLLAGIFKLFGIYSATSALVILSLNNLFSSLACLPVYAIARRVFGDRTALWAGWIWAFFPYSIGLSNTVVWETSLTTLLLPLALWATLRLDHSHRLAAWAGYGALWGLAGLACPACLSVLPFLGGWVWIRNWRRGRNCTGAAVLASLCFFAVMAPWAWRCSRAYGRFVALRGNLGLEILVGNSDDTSRAANWAILPGVNPMEFERLQQVGESAYMAEKMQEARRVIRERPYRFVRLSFRRLLNTWTAIWEFPPRWKMDETGWPSVLMYSFISVIAFAGIAMAIRDRRGRSWPLTLAVLVLPMIYYATHSDMGFRHPIDPALVIFASYALARSAQNRSLRRRATLAPILESEAV